jgi:hypothetical protein
VDSWLGEGKKLNLSWGAAVEFLHRFKNRFCITVGLASKKAAMGFFLIRVTLQRAFFDSSHGRFVRRFGFGFFSDVADRIFFQFSTVQ